MMFKALQRFHIVSYLNRRRKSKIWSFFEAFFFQVILLRFHATLRPPHSAHPPRPPPISVVSDRAVHVPGELLGGLLNLHPQTPGWRRGDDELPQVCRVGPEMRNLFFTSVCPYSESEKWEHFCSYKQTYE